MRLGVAPFFAQVSKDCAGDCRRDVDRGDQRR